MAMMSPDRDPERCPLCEQPNHCAAARGESTCWCFDVQIPNDVLARVPESDRGLRCVCRSCATAPPAERNAAE